MESCRFEFKMTDSPLPNDTNGTEVRDDGLHEVGIGVFYRKEFSLSMGLSAYTFFAHSGGPFDLP